MNDFVVIALIFGNLIYSVHFRKTGPNRESVAMTTLVQTAIEDYRVAVAQESGEAPKIF